MDSDEEAEVESSSMEDGEISNASMDSGNIDREDQVPTCSAMGTSHKSPESTETVVNRSCSAEDVGFEHEDNSNMDAEYQAPTSSTMETSRESPELTENITDLSWSADDVSFQHQGNSVHQANKRKSATLDPTENHPKKICSLTTGRASNLADDKWKLFARQEIAITNKDSLGTALNSEDTNVPEIVRMFSRVTLTTESLNVIRRSTFLKKRIAAYCKEIKYEKQDENFLVYQETVSGIVTLFDSLLSKFPSSCDDIFQILTFMLTTNQSLLRKKRLTDGKLDEIEQLIEQCDTIVEDHLEKKITVQDVKPPPDDFRLIQVYPTALDIQRKRMPFLRKNKIEGSYVDADHYLDVHFRLLREDFLRPLIGGIKSYRRCIKSGNREISKDIKVYFPVTIKKCVCNNEGLCYRIQFETGRRKIQWKYSKRLIFGTLVCLSSDNFENDFIFATVQNRDNDLLDQGCLDIRLENTDGQLRKLESRKQFVMAESTTYFEPYLHVLEGLQSVEVLPFEKYIIHCETQISKPRYSLPKGENKVQLMGKKDVEEICYEEGQPNMTEGTIPALKRETSVNFDYAVPSISDVQLDDTQYKAFQAALTKELALIQGPPGTGKTFVGLKIVETLLKWHLSTSRLWLSSSRSQTPILVVCYTNHALDQFLENILLITKDVVRVGGRSKSEKLDEKNLRNLRFQRETKYDERHARRQVKQLRSDLANTIDRLSHCDQGILCIGLLRHAIPEEHRDLFHLDNDEDVLYWLGLNELSHYKNSVRIPRLQQHQQKGASSSSFSNNFDYFASQRNSHMLDVDNPGNQYDENPTQDISVFEVGLAIYIGEKFYETPHSSDARSQRMNNQRLKDQNDFMYARAQLSLTNQTNAFEHITEAFNIWEMNLEQRWKLYRFWRERYRHFLEKEKEKYAVQYKTAVKTLETFQLEEDCEILQTTKVLGMTTTGAAKFRKLLQKLRPKVIIVEEAAEVLEAHIVSTLGASCEHLILIGDHKQLRPKCTVYDLEENYNLKISLFERLIKNELPYETLLYQRRMRPEIARLLRNIYPELKNHNSVDSYENVRGVSKNYFFINHNIDEDKDADMELNSSSNKHEAGFLSALCKYLLNQGYSSSQITILTPYAGQVKLFQNHMSNGRLPVNNFQEIKISTIDNYQGEENDFVLLSLVRSNTEEKIGFLKDENRVCVSLSRARIGLYVIGNFDLLGSKSTIWKTMVETAKEVDSFGSHLPLFCQNHPDDKGITTKEAGDFESVPEGGCLKPCKYSLECGHVCMSTCHGYDQQHQNYKCREICAKIICETHKSRCKNQCFESCSNCRTLVEKERSDCKHIQRVPCSESVLSLQCQERCEGVLDCGHLCPLRCHTYDDPGHLNVKCKETCKKIICTSHRHKKICRKLCFESCDKCMALVEKELPGCNHVQRIPCGESIEVIQCEHPCEYRLDCGHVCTQHCHVETDPEHLSYECLKSCEKIICEEHKSKCKKRCCSDCTSCTVLVSKEMLICGHLQNVPCGKPLTKIRCKHSCGKQMDCGHTCPRFCYKPCVQESSCKQFKVVTLKCGHENTIHCCTDPTEADCKAPCNVSLKCGHKCNGSCGKCFTGRLHRSCKSKCTRTLVCDHVCSALCTHICPSCEKMCENRCSHSRCPKRCGELCPPCKETCKWSCEHSKCTKMCHEICDRERCNYPCKRNLKCGHECIGLCGEQCPDKCRICHKNEVTDIFFGTEEEPDARFIQISECKHIFEVNGLDQWMEMNVEGDENTQIQMKKCPKCNTIMRRNFRYGNIIKKALGDIELVKSKLVSLTPAERKVRREQLISKTRDKKFTSLLKKNIPLDQLRCLEIVIPLIVHINTKLDKINITNAANKEAEDFIKYLRFQYKKLEHWGKKERNRLSEQERFEAQMEINRLDGYFEVAGWLRKVVEQRVTLSDDATKKLCSISSELVAGNVLEPDTEAVIALKTAIDTQVGVLNISREEQLQILQWGEANGLRKGSWYKCPNGHIYTIGECGGAMERSKCPECNAEIGGTQHRLTDGNTVASVMDGARHAAWSDQANMENYDLDNLA